MKCPVCGNESADGLALCPSCGTALDLTGYDPAGGKPTLKFERDEIEALGIKTGLVARPPPPPKAEVAARCLLSSILSEPIRLEEGTFYRIGRDKTSDICFPSTHVSRLHAEITFEKGSWLVGDLGSKNGTCVNGERVFKRALRDGDKISVGHFELLYRELTSEELAALRAKKPEGLGDTLKIHQDEIGFFGDVKKLSVVEVVQLLGQNRKTGILTINEEKGAPPRILHLLEGAIVHAEFGTLDAERAVQPILRTRTGKFAFCPTPDGGAKITVKTPTATLLLQAMEAMRPAQARES